MTQHSLRSNVPRFEIDVVESRNDANRGRHLFILDQDFKCNPSTLSSYNFAKWDPVVADAMVVAAAIEYADGRFRRPAHDWRRDFELSIPVSNPNHWSIPAVSNTLIDAAEKLTGDYWCFKFTKRRTTFPFPKEQHLPFSSEVQTVMPCSKGMDSMAVAGLLSLQYGDGFLAVQLGPKSTRPPKIKAKKIPFTSVPYRVQKKDFRETSARSRGFKFSLISGLAAHLTGAKKIALPESGQGIFGPVFAQPGLDYPDYRNHPFFTVLMQAFLKALLGINVQFVFPRMWSTKGQTLNSFMIENPSADWQQTRSCWKDQTFSSVEKKWRQCGICAACLLRRVSVFAANLREEPESYICNNMNSQTFADAFDPNYSGKKSGAFREYAIAAVRHMDGLALLAEKNSNVAFVRHAKLLEQQVGFPRDKTVAGLESVFRQHAVEWKGYLRSLDPNSFIRQWSQVDP